MQNWIFSINTPVFSHMKTEVLIIGPKTSAYNDLEHSLTLRQTTFFHLKNISKLRPMSNAEMLIHAFMTSRLDYCNALLGGCSACLINKLQMVQNAAARVLTRTRKYDHISPVLSTLHWLPTKHRIDFKILLITYKALNGLAPQCLSELLSHYSPSRPLISQNSGHLIIPIISKSTAGSRSFSYLHLHLVIWQKLLSKATYNWGIHKAIHLEEAIRQRKCS